ncbi:ribonuclease III [Treponema rectale]|uniref:Ribonuclease 3 n=1 Tax=Treponema rectale TaxID=744512 RepID=A0A840SC21_9SPIR|nr:ribonuclease III [Treponema rectale]MBB5218335.1 ribonuclease-3 [Treponema rectale]QOS39966.1 ribonuclease III [Treponema rectale]
MKLDDYFFEKHTLSQERKHVLLEFCRNLEIKFRDLTLLDLALTHRSYSNENKAYKYRNNERLEFLGDSVLGLATAAFLYDDMENNAEGDLAKIKSNVVSEQTLAPIAIEKMHIDSVLVLGKGEEITGGRHKKAILADAVEAVIGALYLDSGYKSAEKLVDRLIVPEIRKVQTNTGNKDYKTILQEYYQKKCRKTPVYELLRTYGPDCDKTFEVQVKLGNTIYGPVTGKSKKGAEQEAARSACMLLQIK